ncbi:MAG TPA: biotin/lipoyl-binding protein [Candidatus Binatia bacterium]|nr:biotin/lipoyl-binding protein [Candidatus Binatia bacterium]
MRTRLLFLLSAAGLLAGLLSAAFFALHAQPNTPAFRPPSNPYERGVYANGIVESEQASGANVNVYPEVAGTVTEIAAGEGQRVSRGTPLVQIEDSVQRATAEQLRAQATAAVAVVEELRAQPRPETLEVAASQVRAAEATLRTASDQLAKQRASYTADPRSVSRATLDDATNAVRVARANLGVARRQFDLVKAGAWIYDIRNEEAQAAALAKAAAASEALLGKYTIRAPVDGTVLSINATVGSYISSQGTVDPYTQSAVPIVVMGLQSERLAVRAFIDEILIPKLLGKSNRLQAVMYVRGTDVHIPLAFVRVQPYVSPKIELSNARTERVDLRVLPVIFRFERPANLPLYPGQLVDVYVQAE